MVRLVVSALDVLLGLNTHVDSLGKPVQVYVNGSAVFELLINGGVLVLATVRFTAPLVCPCVTASVAPEPRFDLSEKLAVVAVTDRLTVVVLVTPEAVACTVTAMFEAAAILAAVLNTRVLEVELTVTKVQVAPVGNPPAQANVAFPLKLLMGVIVIVVGLLAAPATTLKDVGLGARLKFTIDAAQAVARLLASIEPSPVTRL